MIIACIKCKKQFEIESNLIPEEGRLLQCSACDNKWFYKKNLEKEPLIPLEKEKIKKEIKKKSTEIKKSKIRIKKEFIYTKPTDNKKTNKVKKISILNTILVFIISIIALILVAETFKSPIGVFIPTIEIILENLYETLKDLTLFIQDLF
jgi:predicted Zn finger-like uncharacterized protein